MAFADKFGKGFFCGCWYVRCIE